MYKKGLLLNMIKNPMHRHRRLLRRHNGLIKDYMLKDRGRPLKDGR